MKKMKINELRNVVRSTMNEVHREVEMRAVRAMDVDDKVASLEALPQAQEIAAAVEHKLRTVMRARGRYGDPQTAQGVLFRLIDSSIGTFMDEINTLEELGLDLFPEEFAKVMAQMLAPNFV